MTVIVGANGPTNPYLNKRRRIIQQKKISSVKIHPQYDQGSESAQYDLALVEIKGTFSFSASLEVVPVCIPGKAVPRESHFEERYTLLAYGSEGDSFALNSKPITVATTEVCNAFYGSFPELDPNYE